MNHAFKYTACPGENETLLLTLSILLGKYTLVTLSEFTASYQDKKAFKSVVASICTSRPESRLVPCTIKGNWLKQKMQMLSQILSIFFCNEINYNSNCLMKENCCQYTTKKKKSCACGKQDL